MSSDIPDEARDEAQDRPTTVVAHAPESDSGGRPEFVVAAAFAGGLVLARVLKKVGRSK